MRESEAGEQSEWREVVVVVERGGGVDGGGGGGVSGGLCNHKSHYHP